MDWCEWINKSKTNACNKRTWLQKVQTHNFIQIQTW